MKQILIVDDQSDIRMSAALVLSHHGYACLEADSPASALDVLMKASVDLLLLDMNFTQDTTSGEEGVALLQELAKRQIQVPVVVMTAWANVDLAVQAMQLGACDFLEKPWQNSRLVNIVAQQLKQVDLLNTNARLTQLQTGSGEVPIAHSDAMRALISNAQRVAQTDASILITGENGTGKSMLADYIHGCSARSAACFVSANMGAIPETLFESELFGHKRGAFTDAKEDRIGRFELAQDGTLFLDEIGTLPGSLQSKLLRVLETGEYESLGSSQTKTTNARVITATNADLPVMIEEGRFRKDLLYRLNTVALHIPSLKSRVEDILPLAEHFLAKHTMRYQRHALSFHDASEKALEAHHWPGNVRELSHCIERAVILSSGPVITPQDLALEQQGSQEKAALLTLEEGEKQVLLNAIRHFKGNVSNAAAYLNISKSAIYRRLEKLGIAPKDIH